MKSQEEIESMRGFIGIFNDGRFMTQHYRQGIIDALDFVLYPNTTLERIKKNIDKK